MAELGDYDRELHPEGYVSEFRFVPNQTEELEKAISEHHQKLRGLQPAKAEMGFLDRVKRLEMYGVDLCQVVGMDHIEYFLGTTPKGVVIYHNKKKVALYNWSKIKQMNFRLMEFRITVEGKEYSWTLPSHSSCKHLFQCYIEQHMFFRLRPSMLERNGTLTKSLKSNGSRYSFRTQEEALQNSMRLRRPEPQVQRVPSRRYLRRVSGNDADQSLYVNHSSLMMNGSPGMDDADGTMMSSGRVAKSVAPEPVRRTHSQLSGRESPTSGISIRSVPWDDADGALSDRGLFTRSGESPVHRPRRPHSRSSSPGTSRRRHHHGDRSGSETESISSRKYRYRRSLTGSEASGDETSHRRRRRRRKSRDSSGSDGEGRHRRRSRSRDHMVESESQWNAVQTGELEQSRGEVREPGEAIVKNLKNGYISPETPEGYKWYKERRQIEDIKASTELRKHIQLGLQEPSTELDPLDIPYTKVVTDDGVAIRVSHSPTRQRSRPSSNVYRRSRGDYPDETESMHSAQGSVRSTATRKTDPGPHRSRQNRYPMAFDLVQSGTGGEGRPTRPTSTYESDDQRSGRRRHKRQQDQVNANGRPSRAEANRGGGEGRDDIPSYLLAQRGQGMFSHQQQSEADQYDSAINQQKPPMPYSEPQTSTGSMQFHADQPHPSTYAPPPGYTSSHAPVANGNPIRPNPASSVRPGIHHTREDSGFEQEEPTTYNTRLKPRPVQTNAPPPLRNNPSQAGNAYHQGHAQQPPHSSIPQHHPVSKQGHPSSNFAPNSAPKNNHPKTSMLPPSSSSSSSTNHQKPFPRSRPLGDKQISLQGDQSRPRGSDGSVKHLQIPNGGLEQRSSYNSNISTGSHQLPLRNGLHPAAGGRLHSGVDILAVSELLNELDKLGQGARSSNRSVRSSHSNYEGQGPSSRQPAGTDIGKGSHEYPPTSRNKGRVSGGQKPDFIPDVKHPPPVVVKGGGGKRMSITTSEILRVSRSDGHNRNLLTEL
ncbi:band 4.1-like protein 4A [Lytechinus pictus]|uniref:band 4.1-like protein 4A n=1 Tax=Lytechinus pictus TaxID=7653 RepID=UPI0030B9B58D